MPGLYQTLLNHDLGHLKIIAELWGLELGARALDSAARELCTYMLDPGALRETIEILGQDPRAALSELADARVEWAAFTRNYGGIRDMGAGKRDRERPHRNPISTAEILFYRGLLAKAFFDTEQGAREFAFLADDLIPLLHRRDVEDRRGNIESLGRLATPSERSFEQPADDRILDDATTLLAALRMGVPGPMGDVRLPALLTSARILRKNAPQTESVKNFLAAPRAEALDLLYQAWQASPIFNELRLLPGLRCEGEWTNSPRQTRGLILNFLEALPRDKWWSTPAFLQDLKTKQPDFQRPAGDYDSWFIRLESDGQYLRGFAHWDQIDGAVVRSIIQMLGLLGRADLASAQQNGPVTSFRLRSSLASRAEAEKIAISSNGMLTVPRLFRRAVRYQLARFCEWEAERNDEYKYRISARSLERAGSQGLKAEQLLSMLVKHTRGNVPPALVKALKRWEANGSEAKLEQLSVLRVARPEVLNALRKSRAGKFLGEVIGPTAVVVKQGAVQKVTAVLAELGFLADVISDD